MSGRWLGCAIAAGRRAPSSKRIAGNVILEMVDRGQIRDPR